MYKRMICLSIYLQSPFWHKSERVWIGVREEAETRGANWRSQRGRPLQKVEREEAFTTNFQNTTETIIGRISPQTEIYENRLSRAELEA